MPATAPFLSANALRVFHARLLLKNAAGAPIENPAGLFKRVAAAIARAEDSFGAPPGRPDTARIFERILASLSFLPNSPCLANAGTPAAQLAACFVVEVSDTSFAQTLQESAAIQESGAGTGFSFSHVAPKGSPRPGQLGPSKGPLSLIQALNAATDRIKQSGKRRGANMAVLSVEHPDILDFIEAKRDPSALPHFNLSVGVSDAFMEAATHDALYPLIHPVTRAVVGLQSARQVLDWVADAAWKTGDPGLLFIDAMNRANPTPALGTLNATNPCGETPLLASEACMLGSLNLSLMHTRGGDRVRIDWKRLRATIHAAVRFLDDMIEVTSPACPAMGSVLRGNRKMGLGVMGFADLLIHLGISYDSAEAVNVAETVMKFIATESLTASCALAEIRGVFPNWSQSIYSGSGLRPRNATRTAIAPTGTLSLIAGCSPGIEPIFGLVYRHRHVLDNQTLTEVNPHLLSALKKHGLLSERVLREVRGTGKIGCSVPEPIRRLFLTGHEISPMRQLEIQAAFQRHVDNAVSKTINLPAGTPAHAVRGILLKAWRLGLKGITVYRQGSKPEEVLASGIASSVPGPGSFGP